MSSWDRLITWTGKRLEVLTTTNPPGKDKLVGSERDREPFSPTVQRPLSMTVKTDKAGTCTTFLPATQKRVDLLYLLCDKVLKNLFPEQV